MTEFRTVGTDNDPIVIRRLTEDDRGALEQFGGELSKDDWFYSDVDLQAPAVVNRLINAVEARNWRQLVAARGEQIVGYASLRQLSGWKQTVADVVLVVRSDLRGLGVGAGLGSALLDVARELPISKLSIELVEEHAAARAMFKKLGFHYEGLLEDHAIDQSGQRHSLLVLGLQLPGTQ